MIFIYFLITVSPLIAILLFEYAKKVSSYLASSFLALYFTGILYYIDVIPLTNAIMRVFFFSLLIFFVVLNICFPQSEKDKFLMEIYNVAFQDLFPWTFFINNYGVFLIIPLAFLNYLNIIGSNGISIFLLLALIFILVRQYVLRPYIIKSIVKVTSNADYSPFKDGQKRFRPETGSHLLPKLTLLLKESSLLTSVTSKTSLLTKVLANPDISPTTRKILNEMVKHALNNEKGTTLHLAQNVSRAADLSPLAKTLAAGVALGIAHNTFESYTGANSPITLAICNYQTGYYTWDPESSKIWLGMPETKQHLLLETSIVVPGTKLFPNLAAHYATPEDFLMDQQSKFVLGVELNSENKLIVKGSKMIKLQAELTELKISSQTEIAELKLANERLMAQVKTLELGSNSKVIPWIRWS